MAYKKKYKENFPTCVKSLLINSGYNILQSLKNLDEIKVDAIETFFDQNKELVNQLECSHKDTYKDLETFKFLPGHRTLILSLSEIMPEIEQIILKKKANKSRARAKPANTCLKKKKKKSEAAVKQELLNCLKKVPIKLGFDMFNVALSDANLIDFQKIVAQCECGQECNTFFKCCFVCPVCPKRYMLKYKEFWMSSNATKHIKKHIEQNQTHA